MDHKKLINKINHVYLFMTCIIILSLLGCNKTPGYYVMLGSRYYGQEKYEEAIAAYQKALESNYKSIELYNNLALIYHYEKNDYKKAEKYYKEGLRFFPDVSSLHHNLSQLYLQNGALEKGIEEYRLSVKYSEYKAPSVNTEKIKEELKRRAKTDLEIIEYIKEIVKINPSDYAARYEIAEFYKDNAKFAEALQEYKKVIEIRNDWGKPYVGLGTCYYNLGDKSASLESFKKAKNLGSYVPDEFFEKIEKELKSD